MRSMWIPMSRCGVSYMLQAAIVREGGVPLILAALRTHVGVAGVAESSCTALYRLAYNCEAGQVFKFN